MAMFDEIIYVHVNCLIESSMHAEKVHEIKMESLIFVHIPKYRV